MIADGAGRTIAFRIAPGQAHALPHAMLLLDLPGVPLWAWPTLATPATASASTSAKRGPSPPSPSKRNEAHALYPDWTYTNHNRIKRLCARLKEWRAVATRYEKTTVRFTSVLCLTAALNWIK